MVATTLRRTQGCYHWQRQCRSCPYGQKCAETTLPSGSRVRCRASGPRPRYVAGPASTHRLPILYVDKPMRGHGPMQAIPRVNRVRGRPHRGLRRYQRGATRYVRAFSGEVDAGSPPENATKQQLLERKRSAENLRYGSSTRSSSPIRHFLQLVRPRVPLPQALSRSVLNGVVKGSGGRIRNRHRRRERGRVQHSSLRRLSNPF